MCVVGGIYECVRKVQSWKPCGTEPMSKIYYEWCGDNDWVWVKTIVSYISVELSARMASCMAAIPTVRSIASTPPATGPSFSWWTLEGRHFFAYAKPPNKDTPTVPVLEPPTSAIRPRLWGAVAQSAGVRLRTLWPLQVAESACLLNYKILIEMDFTDYDPRKGLRCESYFGKDLR